MARARGNQGNRQGSRDGRSTGALGPEADRKSGGLPDLARRALAMGLSGVFVTEETIRRALGDALPRDWIDFLSDQGERARADFVERLAGEIARSIESLDWVAMAERFLVGRTIELRAEFRVLPRDTDKGPRRGRRRKGDAEGGGGSLVLSLVSGDPEE